MTVEQFDILFKTQQGVCALCFKPSPSTRRLAVDHCHATGKIRGLLCFRCNAGMGQLGDDPELLRRAATYIEAQR